MRRGRGNECPGALLSRGLGSPAGVATPEIGRRQESRLGDWMLMVLSLQAGMVHALETSARFRTGFH